MVNTVEEETNLKEKAKRKFIKLLAVKLFQWALQCNLIFVFSKLPSVNTLDFYEFTKRKEGGGSEAWPCGLITTSSSL